MKLTGLPLLALLLSTGCAFLNVTVTPPRLPLASSGLQGGNGREIILQTPFVDARPDKTRCGMVKNGYNMDIADVICATEPSVSVAELFAHELSAAGFKLVSASSGIPDSLRLNGELVQFFGEAKLNVLTYSVEVDIAVHLSAKSTSGLRAERDFYVKGEDTTFIPFEHNFQKASERANLQLVREMVCAVITLMDRFPSVGRPSPSVAVSVR